MKKGTVTVSVLLLVVAGLFVSCSKSKPAASSGPEQVTISLWHIHNQEARKKAMEDAARRFEAANPGVHIELSIYENDPYKTKLKTVPGDDFPDVFHSWGGGWLKSFVDAGLVADITASAASWRSKGSDEYLAMNTFDGKLYAAPAIGGSTILFYN